MIPAFRLPPEMILTLYAFAWIGVLTSAVAFVVWVGRRR